VGLCGAQHEIVRGFLRGLFHTDGHPSLIERLTIHTAQSVGVRQTALTLLTDGGNDVDVFFRHGVRLREAPQTCDQIENMLELTANHG
jgi:hypothetical protein